MTREGRGAGRLGGRVAALGAFVLFLVGCDHATKLCAERTLADGPRTVVRGVLDLHYAPNPDIAFSVLRELTIPGKQGLILALTLTATIGTIVAWAVRARRASLLEHLAWGAIVAGAVGNIIDRATRGYVIDFLKLPHWPVFNVADICVVAGVLGLAIVRGRRLVS